jgi:hypothetical protein
MSGIGIYPINARIAQWLVFGTLLLCACILQAQDLSNQTSIFIPEGMELHLGSVDNSGFIQNQGTLRVRGDWQNNNVYQGVGTLWLTGETGQSVFNNRNAVTNLVVDGGGVKTIRGTLPVTGACELLHGLVQVEDNDTLYLMPNAVVSGGSALSYVDGPLISAGTGYKFFPIGSNGRYFPVELLNVSGIQPVNELRVTEGVPALKLPAGSSAYSDVYWSRKTISGVFNRSPVALTYPIDDGYTNRYKVEIYQGADLGASFTALGEATITDSEGITRVTSGSDLTGSFFMIGGLIPPSGVEGKFYMSTSLSPRAANADNHYVRIFGNEFSEESFHFMVYNRWGLLIYENRSLQDMITRGWDGRHKSSGEYIPSGAYPYMLRARTKQGEIVEIKGVISMVN